MKDNITLILRVLILVLMLFIIYLLLTPQNGENEVKTVVSTDTITIHDTVEIKVPVEKIEYKEKKVIDTLYLPTPTPQDKDTIELPIEQKLYEDSISRIWISGFRPKIDSVHYFILTTTNYIDRVVEVEREKKWYEDRFVIFAGTSVGYGIFSKQFDLYVGVGVGIRLY